MDLIDRELLEAACAYINAHAAELHGAGKPDIGPDVGPVNVVASAIRGEYLVLVVDRGIKGSPKYKLFINDFKPKTAPKPAPKPAPKTKPKAKSQVKARRNS